MAPTAARSMPDRPTTSTIPVPVIFLAVPCLSPSVHDTLRPAITDVSENPDREGAPIQDARARGEFLNQANSPSSAPGHHLHLLSNKTRSLSVSRRPSPVAQQTPEEETSMLQARKAR